ncbi:hypothetical protein HK104_003519 [Borealophlyctis nickersoniae]|nr:hypothetical protein HK104_003519 [Borealophlyctis nickersoniae]
MFKVFGSALRAGRCPSTQSLVFRAPFSRNLHLNQTANALVVDWTDSSSSAFSSSTYHYVWLRDNCQCPSCVHPSNRQKLHSSADISTSAKPTSVKLLKTDGVEKVEVVWAPGSLRKESGSKAWNDAHTTTLEVEWLKRYGYSADALKTRREALKPVLWDGATYKANKVPVAYDDFISSDAGLKVALEQLRDYGLSFIRGVPTNDKEVETVARRFGCVRETFYGTSWDVKSVPNAKNIAYTSLFLGLHMDLLYFEAPPGVQLLHCLKNSVKGGESVFVDSFKAVQILKDRYPEDYTTLTRVPVTFHYINDGHHMHFRRPTIVADDLNEHWRVYYAPPFQGPMQVDETDVEAFYRAFQRFNDILSDPALVYTTLLKEGDCVIFANRRTLHGRTEFDAESGQRHLKGAYVDWDDFKDKLRVHGVGKGWPYSEA